MANNSGKRRSKLADMGIEPVEKHYKPPPCPPAVKRNFKLDLTDADLLHVKEETYQKYVTNFAIMQLTHEDGECFHVARIDCCHSMIHRHQFTRDGEDLYDRLEIKRIPPDGGDRWSIVNDGYREAIGTMYEEWADNLRRWRDGR